MSDTEPPPADFDLRLVRFFTVVAKHGNFARAGEELRLAQPTLSRYIQRLEHEIGVQLLNRTPHGSRLTGAGEAFLPQALSLLSAARGAAAAARSADVVDAISIGYVGSLIVTPAVTQLRREHRRAEIRTMHLSWSEARPALLERRVDAVVTRLPVADDGLTVTVLYEEPRVLLVPLDHRLANRTSVVLNDFVSEPLIRYPDPAYNAFWTASPRSDGTSAPHGPLADLHHDKLESVAAGEALALAPAGPANGAPRPDLIAIPVEGLEWSTVVVVTRDAEPSALVDRFLDLARSRLVSPATPR